MLIGLNVVNPMHQRGSAIILHDHTYIADLMNTLWR